MDGEEALSTLMDVTVDGSGAVYVALPDERGVRVFDAGGRPLRTLGRRGRGPGEFERPSQLGWMRDTLWVSDPPLGRVTFFARGERLTGTLALATPAGIGGSPNTPHALLADGSALATPLTGAEQVRAGARIPILRLDRRGRVLDTLALRSAAHGILVLGGGAISSFQPFRDALLTAPHPGGAGVALVERSAATGPGRTHFRVTLLSPRGDTVFSRRYHYTPRPVPRRLADSLVAVAVDGHRDLFPNAAQAERAIRRELYLPRFQPPVTDAVAGRDGTLWLRREELTGAAEVEWLVLSARGDIVARVRAPREFKLYEAERGRAWGVVHDDDGVPYVMRYRVEAPAARR